MLLISDIPFLMALQKVHLAIGLIGFSANADAPAPVIASQLHVTAAYLYVRLIPQHTPSLASGAFCFAIVAKRICECIILKS